MTSITVASQATLRQLVPLDLDAVNCIESAFASLANEAVAMPPVLRLDMPDRHGEVDAKTAYIPGMDSFASPWPGLAACRGPLKSFAFHSPP